MRAEGGRLGQRGGVYLIFLKDRRMREEVAGDVGEGKRQDN